MEHGGAPRTLSAGGGADLEKPLPAGRQEAAVLSGGHRRRPDGRPEGPAPDTGQPSSEICGRRRPGAASGPAAGTGDAAGGPPGACRHGHRGVGCVFAGPDRGRPSAGEHRYHVFESGRSGRAAGGPWCTGDLVSAVLRTSRPPENPGGRLVPIWQRAVTSHRCGAGSAA